jgi:tetratricopeptide (TPR) repeat protein
MNRLQYFLTIDDAARQKSAVLAIVIGAIVGMGLELSGQPFDLSAYIAVGVLSAVFTIRVFWYCSAVAMSKRVSVPTLPRRSLLKAATAAAALFIVGVIPTPRIEAEVLDRRLRALTRRSPLSPEAAEQIADDLNLAEQWKIPLPHQTLVQVRDTIKKSALQAPQSAQSAPLAKPANALVDYDRQDSRVVAELRGVPPLAVEEAHRGQEYLFRGNAQGNRADLILSLEALTNAIELSNGNARLQATYLLMRAMTNSSLGNDDAALADVRAAEALGSLEIFYITLIEGVALADRTNPQDLRRAINLLTLSLQLKTDPSLDPLIYQLVAHSGRCEAYFRLGEYQKAAADAREALATAMGNGAPLRLQVPEVNNMYKFMILSYLGLQDYQEALKSANEYRARVGSPEAEQWFEMVQRYPQDPRFVWNSLYGELMSVIGAVKTP